MGVQRTGGAVAALLLAGLAYLWKNRKQVGSQVKQLGDSVQDRLSSNQTSKASLDEPKAYTGETTRI